MQKILIFLTCCLLLLQTSQPAYALRLIPFQSTFKPTGTQANKLFIVENNTDHKRAVQASILRRSHDEHGKEHRTDASQDFIIYPKQFIIEAGKSKSVRVQYIGKHDPTKEQAYRIIVEELPIQLEQNTDSPTQINFLTRYEGAIYVTPNNASADIKLQGYSIEEYSNRPHIKLTFTNEGNRHQVIHSIKIRLTETHGRQTILSDNTQTPIVGSNLLAHSKRHYLIPLPETITSSISHVEFDFN